MRVLNLVVSLDGIRGGAAERTFQVSRYLSKYDIDCTILTLDLGLNSEIKKNLSAVKIVALPCLWERFYIPKLLFRKIYRLIQEVDVIHFDMNHWTLLNVIAYFYAQYLKKPYIICPAGALQPYGRSLLLKRVYNSLIGKAINRNASGYVAITEFEAQQFIDCGINPDKIVVIPNGISVDELSTNYAETAVQRFRTKHKLGKNPILFFLGRLNSIKGPDLLLKAFSRIKDEFPSYYLVFGGPDDGMMGELQELVAAFNLEHRIHFIGYLDKVEKYDAFMASDLLIIPSRREAMSLVALEAGSTCTPVLLTDQCGFDEISEIGGGSVVPATVEGLEQGLLDLLSSPSDLKEMGKTLRDYAVENFSWDSIIQKYIGLYKNILRSP